MIGAVPGLGGTVAAFLAYTAAMQISKHPETFGKGNIEGVIGPESANNAKDGGALIPTLAFGVPGSAEMAVFLGVLVLHGLDPGPMLLIEHEGVIFSLILALSASCIIATLITLSVARYLVMITLVDVHVLVPAVIAVSLVGVYALKETMGDVVLAGAVRPARLSDDAVPLSARHAGDRADPGRDRRAQLLPVAQHGERRLDDLLHAGSGADPVRHHRRLPDIPDGPGGARRPRKPAPAE